MNKLSNVLYALMIVAGSFTFMCCSTNLYPISYNNGFVSNHTGKIIATYRNGYILNNKETIIGTYRNGYVLNAKDSVIATYNNGRVFK
jgi:hypothetical protein